MVHQKEITVDRPLGSNDIATIVSVSNEFQSEIHIRKENKQVNLKSHLGVYSLRLAKNDEVTIICHGPDSEVALNTVVRYFMDEKPLSYSRKQ
ncbi:MAG: HPr family phosphocarrier protein [Thermicanus sp.]|nr:HPr family phosphocarrier protein [Thermicanus sp.]